MKNWIKTNFPAPVTTVLKVLFQYALRLFYWSQVVVSVRGDGRGEQIKLLLSAILGPITALFHLMRWQYPKLVFDTRVRIKDVGRFQCSAYTDHLFQVIPYAQSKVRDVLCQHLKLGETFVDAGANIGFFTILGSRLVGESGRVFSVEMMPQTAARLRHNIAINDLRNIHITEGALSDQPGQTIVARQPVGSSGQASVSKIDLPGRKVVECQVTTTTLDQVVEGVKEIALLKIDVEGHEAAVFAGGRNMLARTRAVVFESWAGYPRSDAAIRQIEEAGFTIIAIDEYNMLAVRSESGIGEFRRDVQHR